MTGLLVLAVPVVLTLVLSGDTVMSLLGCTRWGVASLSAVPIPQAPATY